MEVTERLVAIRTYETIPHNWARRFWKKNWLNKEELRWDEFAKSFKPYQTATPDQKKMQTMMFLQKGKDSPVFLTYQGTVEGAEILTDERFGLCTSWFGGKSVFVKNVEKIIKNPAFFGDQSPRRV